MSSGILNPLIKLFEDACICLEGHEAIEWPNMTVRRLASFLALNHGQKFSRREVSDALWTEGRYRSNSLSVALYQLRHSLEDQGLDAGLVFNTDRATMGVSSSNVSVDWQEFITQIRMAEAMDSPQAALSALNTVTGPLLHEIGDVWAVAAKAEFNERIAWCLSLIGNRLPEDQLTAGTEEMARVISLCSHPTELGDQLAEKLAYRSPYAAKRFSQAAHRLGIELSHPTPIQSPSSPMQHLGVLLLVQGADSGVLDGVDQGLDPGMELPNNAAAFLDPTCALAAANRVAESHPSSKVLISVELFDSPTEIPPGAWAVMKQMRGPGVHIDTSTPLKRSRLIHGKRHVKGVKHGTNKKLA